MLRTGTPEQISTMYQKLNGEVKSILNTLNQLIYFMRGAVSYEYALYGLSYVEREMMLDYISQRLESESKNMYPNY